jgi:hypothetical protein
MDTDLRNPRTGAGRIAASAARPGCSCAMDFLCLAAPALLLLEQLGIGFFQVLDLWQIPVGDIGVPGIAPHEILMVVLGGVELRQRHDLGHDRFSEAPLGIHSLDDAVGSLLLLVAVVKDYGALLGADIGALKVQLSGIVGDVEKYLQQQVEGDNLRIENGLHAPETASGEHGGVHALG